MSQSANEQLISGLKSAAEIARQLRDEYEGDDLKRERLRWYARYLTSLAAAAERDFGQTEVL